MLDRQRILHITAHAILQLPSAHVVRVGIDGVDGAGRSMLGDELAQILIAAGSSVIRASVDGFHNPRAIRYRLGRQSPEGYFRNSYDYAQLKALLLDPLSPGGNGRYRPAAFDHRTDQPVTAPEAQAAPGDILVFDGIFLHRPELRGYWDYSIFLEVSAAVSMARCAQRDGTSPDPHAPDNRRYVEGQQIYLRTCEPWRYATVAIKNEALAAPTIAARSTQG